MTRRSGRPRAGEQALSREAILDAALRIVDADGLAGLSMRRLAGALGVNPMSIYHHLPGKSAVVSGLVDRVFAQVEPTARDGRWQDQLIEASRAYRRVLSAHRHLALQIVSDPNAVSHALVAAGEPFYAALDRAGLPPRRIVEAVDTIIDFIHGFMLGEASSPGESFEIGAALVERDTAQAPTVARVVAALGEEGLRYDFDRGFDVGLEIIVRGIEARDG